MHTIKNFKTYILLSLICMLTFSGCQSLQPTEKSELSLQDSEFMDLWTLYNDCVIDQNPLQMQEYVAQLSEAPGPITIHHSPIPLPKFLKNWTSARSSRLSVDPRAMAVSCALQAGQAAWQTGRYLLAQDLMQSIIDEYPEPAYAYYVSEARTAILKIPSFRNVSLTE
ncbi:MAG: hypothetical protein NPIRA04_34710 [Nitrospirales bacterium]|nr:MAG: hypothetical protein NPIRA04_34710 [Nitrospirales bacterium]